VQALQSSSRPQLFAFSPSASPKLTASRAAKQQQQQQNKHDWHDDVLKQRVAVGRYELCLAQQQQQLTSRQAQIGAAVRAGSSEGSRLISKGEGR